MRIKKIILQNGYKRFKKTTIDLGESPRKIVVLTGPNGSGKSSVFDGMLYLQHKHVGIGQYGAKNWEYHSMEQDPGFESKWQDNVKIEFDLGDFTTVYQQKNTTGNPGTIFSFRGPHRHYSNLKIKTLSVIPDIAKNDIGASSTVDLDDKITQNYQRLYSLIDRKFKKDGKIGYDDVKKQIIGELNIKLKNVLGLEIYDHGDIQDGKGTLFFKKTDQEKPFEFNVLSSGEKEVVDILLDIFLKKEVFNDSIYIIDEPELHINTSIQRKLLKEVVEMIPSACQLWIATHSIGFLNGLKQDYNDESEIIWFEGKFGSEDVVLAPIKKTRENWRKIFQTALEDLTGLLAPEKIIYCEGRKDPTGDGEEQGLDAEVYNLIFEEEYPDVLFVSSGGNTQPDQYGEIAIAILKKAFQDVELLILKDMDINSKGSVTTEEQRKKWLLESSNRRMLNRKEIENYLLDYEIIKKAYPDIIKEEYNKIIPDINVDTVKDNVGDIMRLCGIMTGMNKNEFLIHLSGFITNNTSVYGNLKDVIFNN